MSYYDETIERTTGPLGHRRARLERYRRGMSIPWNRPVYGWRWSCECGATERTNARKREAIARFAMHRLHVIIGTADRR